mgnify:CR=1 FL=1
MGNVYIIFDYKTAYGYLPFCYTHKTLSSVLKKVNENRLFYEKLFDGNKKDITFNLDERNMNDDNIYIILIDSKIKNIDLKNILSKKLLNLINKSDNFIINYFDYGIEEMRSLI